MSADYLAQLRDLVGDNGCTFVNAGINGDLAWNVLQRVDDIVACHPDAVTLLVGTNDVLASLGPSWEATYRRQQHIRETPTLAWYGENVRAIIDRLRAGTGARLAILDLPPLGEDLASGINERVREYNAVLRNVAAQAGVDVLPLHDGLVSLLPEGHEPPPFEGRRDLMGSAMARRLVLRRSWNEVSTAHGLAVLTDHVHLNDRAATVVSELIADWLVDRQ
jgi:acyl-CoA thioesterase-1